MRLPESGGHRAPLTPRTWETTQRSEAAHRGDPRKRWSVRANSLQAALGDEEAESPGVGLTGGSAVKNPAASGETGSDPRPRKMPRHGHKPVHPALGPRALELSGWQQEKALHREACTPQPRAASATREKLTQADTRKGALITGSPVARRPAREWPRAGGCVDSRWADAASSLDIRLPSQTQAKVTSAQSRAGRFSQRPVPPHPSLTASPAWLPCGWAFASHSAQTSGSCPSHPVPARANGPSSSVPFAEPGTNHLSARLFPIPQSARLPRTVQRGISRQAPYFPSFLSVVPWTCSWEDSKFYFQQNSTTQVGEQGESLEAAEESGYRWRDAGGGGGGYRGACPRR